MAERCQALVPGNLVVKYGAGVDLREADCMIYARNRIKLPVPEVIGCLSESGINYIVMLHIEGKCLDECWQTMDPINKENVIESLASLVDRMRKFTFDGERWIGSVLGGPCLDPILDGIDVSERGPFENVAGFHGAITKALHKSHDSYFSDILTDGIGNDYPIVFTHGDLAPRNIMVSGAKVVALLDWEFSGFYPEYWETEKLAYNADWRDDWVLHMQKIAPTRLHVVPIFAMIRRIIR